MTLNSMNLKANNSVMDLSYEISFHCDLKV